MSSKNDHPTGLPVGHLIAAIVAAVSLLGGCELINNEADFVDDTLPEIISFSTSVQPVLEANCTACHGGTTAEGGLRLDSWERLVEGSNLSAAVVPFQPAHSLLIRLISEAQAHPADVGGDTLAAADVDVLRKWVRAGARNDDREVPYSNTTDPLYVADPANATVSIIDRGSNFVVRVVDLVDSGFSPAARPVSIAVEPDGSAWYVSLAGDNVVVKFSSDNRVVGQTPFVAAGPLALHPDENLLYVSRDRSVSNPPLSVAKIDRSSMAATIIPVLYPRPHAVSVDPSGAFVYVGSFGQNQISSVSVETDSVSFLPVDGATHGLLYSDVSEVSALMITTGLTTSTLLVHDVSNPDTVRFVDELPLNAAPSQPAFIPDGTVAYVPSTATNSVSRVTMDPLSVDRVIVGTGIASPEGIVVSADGRFVYVANRNPAGAGEYVPRYTFQPGQRTGTVTVIDTESDSVIRVIEVGTTATALAARDS